MSRKGVGRGRKYTTGVFRDPKTGRVYQTTARRGCLSMVLAVVGMVAVLVMLAACEPEPVPKQGRGMRTPIEQEVKQDNVNRLCDAVKVYDGSEDARGNLGLLAEMSGIPDSLKDKGVAYSRNPSTDQQALVLLECATLGWQG